MYPKEVDCPSSWNYLDLEIACPIAESEFTIRERAQRQPWILEVSIYFE